MYSFGITTMEAMSASFFYEEDFMSETTVETTAAEPEFISEVDKSPWELEGPTLYSIRFGITEEMEPYVELLGTRMSSLEDDTKIAGEEKVLSIAYVNATDFRDKVLSWPEAEHISDTGEMTDVPPYPGLKIRHYKDDPDSPTFPRTHMLLMSSFEIYNGLHMQGFVDHPNNDAERYFPTLNRDFSLGFSLSEDGKEALLCASIRNHKLDKEFCKKTANFVLRFQAHFRKLLVAKETQEEIKSNVRASYKYHPVLQSSLVVKVSFGQVMKLLGINPDQWAEGILKCGTLRAVGLSPEEKEAIIRAATPVNFHSFSADMMFFLAWATLLETTRTMTLVSHETHDFFQLRDSINPVALEIVQAQ